MEEWTTLYSMFLGSFYLHWQANDYSVSAVLDCNVSLYIVTAHIHQNIMP